MERVYELYLNAYKKSTNQDLPYRTKKISEAISFDARLKNKFDKKTVKVTEIKPETFFISNGISKGFLYKKTKPFDKLDEYVNKYYRGILSSFGTIIDTFNFKNIFFTNLSEIFSCDEQSIGLGALQEDFTKKSNGKTKIGNIDIKEIYTFAYEANGNVWNITPDGAIYLYAPDHCYRNISALPTFPEDTFYTVDEIRQINDFFEIFLDDFCSD